MGYQLCRSLAYIHSLGVCHRDIKPQNLLVHPETHLLKLCDFGSAKILVKGEPNVSYICSRYYRAPELIFGATDYTCCIDVWSVGCVLAELLLGVPLFPQVKPHPWHKVFRPRTPSDAIELVSRFLRYSPDSRIKPLEGCAMPFFDELRDQGLQLPGNRSPPPLFDFKPQELFEHPPSIRSKLTPDWFKAQQR